MRFYILPIVLLTSSLGLLAKADSQIVFSSNLKDSGVTNVAADADNHTFDYIVVGGGLTGITVAARLAEDNDQVATVLVIEAGEDDRKNDLGESTHNTCKVPTPD